MLAINFYLLSADKPLAKFVCQLIQTGLNKSLDDLLLFTPTDKLAPFDELLWAFDPTAFIPHDILPANMGTANPSALQARVQLTDNPAHVANWTGVVINVTDTTVGEFNGTKLLEVIAADALDAGRQKYRTYQQRYPHVPLKTYPQ